MRDEALRPVKILCRRSPSFVQFFGEGEIRLVAFGQRRRQRRPIVHLGIDVDRIVGAPRRRREFVPDALQGGRLRSPARRGDGEIPPEGEEKFVKPHIGAVEAPKPLLGPDRIAVFSAERECRPAEQIAHVRKMPRENFGILLPRQRRKNGERPCFRQGKIGGIAVIPGKGGLCGKIDHRLAGAFDRKRAVFCRQYAVGFDLQRRREGHSPPFFIEKRLFLDKRIVASVRRRSAVQDQKIARGAAGERAQPCGQRRRKRQHPLRIFQADHHHVVGIGAKISTFAAVEGYPGGRVGKIERAAVIYGFAAPEGQRKVAERQIDLRPHGVKFLCEKLLRFGDPAGADEPSRLGKRLRRAGFRGIFPPGTRPERVVVERDPLLAYAAVDHSAESAVSDRIGFLKAVCRSAREQKMLHSFSSRCRSVFCFPENPDRKSQEAMRRRSQPSNSAFAHAAAAL